MPVLIRVGELYAPPHTRLQQGAEYNWRGGQHELRIFMAAPQQDELRRLQHGALAFALYCEEELLFFLWECPGVYDWSDNPFNLWRVAPEERTIPDQVAAGYGAALIMVVADATTGLVRALRALALPHDVSVALIAAIRRQGAQEITAQREDDLLRRAYARYPSSAHMARAAQVRCVIPGRLGQAQNSRP